MVNALREILGLDALYRGDPDAPYSEPVLSASARREFEQPDRPPAPPQAERWRPPRELGWFGQQRALGIGITKGKKKPRYPVRPGIMIPGVTDRCTIPATAPKRSI